MSIPTVAVTCTAYDQNGNAVAGGTFRARLNSTEIYNGFVVPEQVTGVADASGVCVLQLWPNALGVAGSAYRITAINPDTGQKYLDTTAVVPNSACNLHQIIVAAPYPTVDASQQALVAAQGALAAVTAQAGIATTKAAEASASATTAATQAGIATTQAGTATTQAGIATIQATTATTQADIAAIQAGIATTKASEASASAATATTQAGIATTKASEAAASAATATTQAGTATTQAGVATTKASEAAASATNASNSAYTAGLSVDAAVTAKNQAVSSASAAASSATAASGSATAASTSASSASASASTATTQAGTATTQAGLATTAATTATSKASEASTYASNASASANTATTQAGVATTQAGIATTQAGVATTQAGIAIANANAALSVYGSVTAQQAAVTAAQNAATSATASATAANTSAGNASGSAASALAIYGTTAAQQAALTNAQSAASLAQGYALSASSAIQQDLSGVTAQALHRSPNAVTSMFVYDTSKDSDGGAWTEKCQHTSWYNEVLNGKWLGAHDTEFQARNAGATLGIELSDTISNAAEWTVYGANTLEQDGTAVKVTYVNQQGGAYSFFRATKGLNTDLVVGKSYRVSFSAKVNAGSVTAGVSTSTAVNYKTTVASVAYQTYSVVFVATSATGDFFSFDALSSGEAVWVKDISVREVTALTTASGDYYQSTVDGKFYKLSPTSGVSETFRGNKADFPRLAGIVAEAASVTIYDLTEAGRPMWMRFVGINGQNNMLNSGMSVGLASVFALQGRMGVAGSNASSGCVIVNFPADASVGYSNASQPRGRYRGDISQRQLNKNYDNADGFQTTNSSAAFAIAMTVLPDAPVDAVTGLQVPTIAVATAAGVSVIKHNGTVVNSSATNAFARVAFVDNQYLWSGFGGYNNFTPRSTWEQASFNILASLTYYDGTNQYPLRALHGGDGSHRLVRGDKQHIIAGSKGAQILKRHNNTRLAAAADITNTFNTGHLIGDIRRAYLADVDVGSVSGTTTQLVNPSEIGGNWTNNGSGSFTCNGSVGYLRFNNVLSTGKAYKVTLTVNSGSGSLLGIINGPWDIQITAPGTYTYLVNITAANYVQFYGNGFNGTISNIQLSEAAPERSYKSKPAEVTGTLTKTQVAAASQLVAYSGFSAANYLREPYSADLDFGTGEWSASAWVNVPAVMPAMTPIGATLITNGTFNSDISGFSIVQVNGTASWNAGRLRMVASGAGNTYFSVKQTIATEIGKSYVVSADAFPDTTFINVQLQIVSGSFAETAYFTVTNKQVVFVARATTTDVSFQLAAATVGYAVEFDNLSVYELSPSAIAHRAYSSGASIRLGIGARGEITATAFDGTNPARTVTTTAAYNTATWIKPEAVYTTDGTLAIRVNGVEVAATRGAPLLTLNNSNAVLTIGNSFAADAPFPGSISLLKLSATVPTSEQSQWMYEQEKQMFRDGAQVCLPDSGAIVDLTYDDATDKWIAVSATNESEWSGLVRTSVTPSPAGSYNKTVAASGIQMHARINTNPGVDINIPAYGLREELVNRSQAAARLARNMVAFDYVGGFTANTTTGATSITSVASLTYPVSYVGARISGAGIPANTTVVGVSGTTIYISAAATATASGVQISFVDFTLPVGYEAREVLTAGLAKIEGATKDFTRLFDGFKETIRFGTAPGYNAAVQIQATRSAS